MSDAAYIATIVAVTAFMLGAVVSVILFVGGSLGDRIGSLESRFSSVEDIVQHLREDVAVLKATR